MDPQYYLTTLTNAAMKLGPTLLYLVMGFFLFIKLPFWLLTITVKHQRVPQNEKLEEYDAFIQRINDRVVVEFKKEGVSHSAGQKSGQRASERKHRPSEPKPQEKVRKPAQTSPRSKEEQLFDLSANEIVTKAELKKKYHNLIRIHHPDKVASLAPEFRKLAEIKTKEINSAYHKLQRRAA